MAYGFKDILLEMKIWLITLKFINILDSGEERIGELVDWYKIIWKTKHRETGGKYESLRQMEN